MVYHVTFRTHIFLVISNSYHPPPQKIVDICYTLHRSTIDTVCHDIMYLICDTCCVFFRISRFNAPHCRTLSHLHGLCHTVLPSDTVWRAPSCDGLIRSKKRLWMMVFVKLSTWCILLKPELYSAPLALDIILVCLHPLCMCGKKGLLALQRRIKCSITYSN